MLSKIVKPGLTRRTFLQSTAAAATASSLPRLAHAQNNVIRIGFLAPLTGAVAAWGKPGLDGCQIWAERVNAAGGIQLSDGAYQVGFVAYVNEYDPA